MLVFRRPSSGLSCAAALALIATSGASAGLIQTEIYQLNNHPFGIEDPPPYGLRLDELFDVTSEKDIFTFDFEHPESSMTLTYDGSSIVIEGTAFGGRDIGSEYAEEVTTGVYEIFFEYDFGVGPVPGDEDDLWAVADGQNSGTIALVQSAFPNKEALPDPIPLVDKSNGEFSFRFGDEDDDTGHRNFDGISGWGWLTHGDGPHVFASDWLFTAELIPTPGSLLLFGLGALTISRRRR